MAAAHSISDSGSSDEEDKGKLLSAETLKRQNVAGVSCEATRPKSNDVKPQPKSNNSGSADQSSEKNAIVTKHGQSSKADGGGKSNTSSSSKRASSFSVAKFINDVSSSDEEETTAAKKIKTNGGKEEKRSVKTKKDSASSGSQKTSIKPKTDTNSRVKNELSDDEATDIDEKMVSKLEARWKSRKANRQSDEQTQKTETLSLSHTLSDSDDDEAKLRQRAIKDSKVTPKKETNKDRKSSPVSSQSSTKTPSNSIRASPDLFAASPSPNANSKVSPSNSSSSTSSYRPPCRYGLTCYRQKPSHWNKVSHPDEVSSVGKGGKMVWIRPNISPVADKRSASQGGDAEDDDDVDDDNDDSISSKDDSLTLNSSSLSSSWSNPRLIQVISEAEPHNYFLTKVSGIDDNYNSHHALSMKDILSPLLGTLETSVQFNYCIDVDWMMSQYPPQFRQLPLLVVHGLSREAKAELIAQASQYSPYVRLAQAKLPDPFGTHHTKMMILKYAEGLRVAITTANLIAHDWHQKTQGIWLSPLFPQLSGPVSDESIGDSKTGFKRDLLSYLRAYRLNELKMVEDMIRSHDMSSCRVFLLGSIPGRHQGAEKLKWGHMRLRKILEEHQRVTQPKATPTLNIAKSDDDGLVGKSWYLIAQFSSLGSLGNSASQWLQAEFAASLSSMNPRGGGASGGSSSSKIAFNALVNSEASSSKFRLVFPCVDDVANSLEGYQAGASIPYARATAAKQAWLKAFMHKWRADKRGRTRAAPHIKSFAQIDPTHSKAAWFVSTSANLSKAAWGALEKNQSQLFIRSYELGVVFLPQHFADVASTAPSYFDLEIDEQASRTDRRRQRLAFPLDLPLTPYGQTDEPWLWDVNHTKRLDSHGCTWEPNKR